MRKNKIILIPYVIGLATVMLTGCGDIQGSISPIAESIVIEESSELADISSKEAKQEVDVVTNKNQESTVEETLETAALEEPNTEVKTVKETEDVEIEEKQEGNEEQLKSNVNQQRNEVEVNVTQTEEVKENSKTENEKEDYTIIDVEDYIVYSTTSLNLREGSSTKYNRLSSVSYAEEMIVTDKVDNEERLFEPGYTTTSGTGIGLSTIKKYIEKSGGRVTYNREYTHGFEVVLHLMQWI